MNGPVRFLADSVPGGWRHLRSLFVSAEGLPAWRLSTITRNFRATKISPGNGGPHVPHESRRDCPARAALWLQGRRCSCATMRVLNLARHLEPGGSFLDLSIPACRFILSLSKDAYVLSTPDAAPFSPPTVWWQPASHCAAMAGLQVLMDGVQCHRMPCHHWRHALNVVEPNSTGVGGDPDSPWSGTRVKSRCAPSTAAGGPHGASDIEELTSQGYRSMRGWRSLLGCAFPGFVSRTVSCVPDSSAAFVPVAIGGSRPFASPRTAFPSPNHRILPVGLN